MISKCGDVEFTFQGIWKHSEVVSGKLTPQFGTTIEYMLINNEDKNNQFIQFSNGDTYKGRLYVEHRRFECLSTASWAGDSHFQPKQSHDIL